MAYEQYHFRSHWDVEAPASNVWEVLALPQLWHVWWPELSTMHVLDQPKTLEGTLLVGVWKSRLGYKLQTVFDIEKVKEGEELLLRASGDLTGYVLVQLQKKSKNKTVVRFTWDIKTTRTWMNKLAPTFKKIFTKSHNFIMSRGEKGLNAYIKSQQQNE